LIVSNATPLISFSRIGQLDLMRRVIGQTLVIPEAVATEILGAPRASRGAIDLAQEPWIQIERVESRQQVELLLPSLDPGEAEVIALALERRARLVLIDEFIGRKIAESLGLPITGSVGLLIRAKQMGEIPAVKPLMMEMIQHGIRFGAPFVQAVLRHVQE
jgi:predicted nucleic acid-binding protein